MSLRTAVVLAAGEGNRLRPLTHNRPKPMLPAANRPVLEYVFDALIDAGIEEIVVVIGYKRDRVQEHFGPTYDDIPLQYVAQEKQLGSGHALLEAQSVVDEPFLMVNGDRVIESGLVTDVIGEFEAHPDAAATLGVLEHRDARHYGAVALHEGRIEEIVEKPDSDDYRLINSGVYAFRTSIFESIEATERRDGELQLPDTLAGLIDAGEAVRGVQIDGLSPHATYPWDLLTVTREILARGRVDEPAREQGVWVDDSALVHDDATLQAPVVVGPDCEVGPGAVVGPDVALGRNVTVEANATVERSVLDTDTRIGPGSTILDCVTGQDVTLGAANTVPGGPADVRIDTQVYEEQPLGAVVADRVHAGGAVTLAPGTLVGPGARLHTGVRTSGRIEADAEVLG
ncbi:sugar phosphate nucleotidyltransferase [Halococcus saccharolyticus]|uniref:Bifunctional protein GlmU n=1 Tax=Halococcus saccharolyticus DSM 5350 TaxID=1227455 RepID=M0MCP6_9EURY|nr:sugar phosphate nucleotidyltransferase [Halococcus saccharolyticus]EMA43118.1 nucleotidyl transferase [Halococcus saccharolyticus DSM 5350]